jgi:GntR family transcriptional regulator
MLIEIDAASAVPIYSQIAACVRRAIGSRAIKPGDRLPPIRDLAEELDINMHTAQRAYVELRDEGLIELRQGRGAIVARNAAIPFARLNAILRDLLAEAREQGVTTNELVKMLEAIE